MDFSILYRVLYNPRRVFEQIEDKPRLEPFIIVGIFAVLLIITAYISDGKFFNNFIFWILGLPLGLFLLLLKPIIESWFIYLLAFYNIIPKRYHFHNLINIFVVCTIPFYMEIILIRLFALILSHKYYAITYSFINPIRLLLYHFNSVHPIFSGMLATFSLSFFWSIFLWWIALTHLLRLKSRTALGIVLCLVVLNMFVGGIFGFVPYIISKCRGGL